MVLSVLRDEVTALGSDKQYVIALSGGLDSQTLLHACARLRDELALSLTAVHIHHGLSAHADEWAAHCEKACHALTIPLTIHRLAIQRHTGESLENLARSMRYAVFAQHMTNHTVLLTAHHQDDQAETVLLQLLRGAGPKGLSAMPKVKAFHQGMHARPLLSVSRLELASYARDHGIHWVEDDSNADVSFSRNYIRQHVMPVLNARWPSASAMMARSAMHCAEQESLLRDEIHALCDSMQGVHAGSLSVSKLRSLSHVLQKNVLRAWIARSGVILPSVKKCEAILSDVIYAGVDRQPVVSFGEYEVRRFRDDLFLLAKRPVTDDAFAAEWDPIELFALPDGRRLVPVKQASGGLAIPSENHRYHIRYRQGGEVVFLPHRGHKTLKNMLYEWGVPPWERSRLPLVFDGDTLIAIPGCYSHPEWQAKDGESGVALKLC